MFRETIYQKSYPRDLFDETTTQKAETAMFVSQQEDVPSAMEMLEQLERNTVYIPIPGRDESKKQFIQNAIEVSELYEIDTEIQQFKSHVSVTLSFDCGGGMQELRRILAMGDDYSFFTHVRGHDITMSVDYYTHYVVRNGYIVAP